MTSSDDQDPVAILIRICVAGVEVISNSCWVNHPDVFGKFVTSFWSSGGRMSAGMIHSVGMDALRASRF